ncbi:hypothetical protein F4860DRAFT_485512 [Xylaria cubensis]|nr:hypothetical protein F4860DRAFT_485512 [Xylaria cubensis]
MGIYKVISSSRSLYFQETNFDFAQPRSSWVMPPIAPEDIVALVTSLISLLVEILSLLLAYRTFLSMRRARHEERLLVGRRRTMR